MRSLRLIVSALILLTLGMTLGAEAMERISHSSNFSEVLAVTDCEHSEHADNHCADPCHTGQCHLGHCSFIFGHTPLKYYQSDVRSAHLSVSTHILDGPHLEGHRRPPRIA